MAGITYGSGGISAAPNTGSTLQTGVQLGAQIYNAATAPNASDPRRFQEAQDWYTAAINGDRDAACSLQYHSGRFGCTTCGRFGSVCGHATQIAKDYDYTLYQQLVKVQNGQLPASTPIPPAPNAPQSSTLQTIANTAQTVSDTAGAIATGLGQPSTPLGSPEQTRERLTVIGYVLVFAAIAGVVYFVARARR